MADEAFPDMTDDEFMEAIKPMDGLMGQLTPEALRRLTRIGKARKDQMAAASGMKQGAPVEDVGTREIKREC